MAWHLWGQGSISHHPTLGGTEKMLSWPNLPYAVLDKHSSNVAGYHEVAKMRFEYLWLVRIKKIEDAVGVLSVHQYNEQRWGQVMLRLNKSIQFWSCISTVYAQTRDACISPTGAAMDFQGTQVPLKWQGSAEAVTKTSNNAHVQRRLKPAVLVLQTANQLENSQPLPHLHHPKKKSTSFWCQPLPFPREVSSNCWEPQVTGWPAASAKCQALPPGS